MPAHTRYSRGVCATCRQLVWLSEETPAQDGDGGAPKDASSSSSSCRRCRLNLSLPARTCGICLDMMTDPFRYVNVRNESWDNNGCGHAFCRECLRAYVRSRLSDAAWSIRCPAERCSYRLLDKDMVRLLLGAFVEPPPHRAPAQGPQRPPTEGQALLERYRALRSEDHGAHLREVLRRLGGAAAGGAAADDAGGAGALADDAAAAEGRADGGSGAAEGHADGGFGAWAAEACQACPKCLIIVRKEVGCDHVHCRCGADFCYGCGAPYDQRPSCMCGPGSRQAGAPRLARWLQAHGRLGKH